MEYERAGDLPFENHLKVLVMEKDDVSFMVLKATLAHPKIEIHRVETGEEVIDRFLEGIQYDLIVINKQMPGIDGPEVARELTAMDIGTKMVAMSADEEDEQEFLEAGADEFYPKPLAYLKLVYILKELDDYYM